MVAKPATQRPKLPSVGRLGLVEPSASGDLDRLGWNTDTHVELLWSLSRAPDADDALRAIVRLADAVGRKLVYGYGFIIFTAGSAACGLAPSLGLLVGFRVVQAAGAVAEVELRPGDGTEPAYEVTL